MSSEPVRDREEDWLLNQLTQIERVRSGNPKLILNRIEQAAVMARELMRGDKATFKQGYTRENAVIFAQEKYPEFTRDQISVQLSEFDVK